MSCISTDVGEMCTILYRRSTISPSPAIHTSSPCSRKIFFGSPTLLAKPKNFSGIGGGCGTGGGVHGPCALGPSGDPGAIGGGITTSASDTKIFLPLPSYCVCSAEASRSSLKVGSRFSGRTFFPVSWIWPCRYACGGWRRSLRIRSRVRRRSRKHRDEFISDQQQGQSAQHRRPRRLLLVFQSQLHYVPTFKYVSSFTLSLIGPCGSPPRLTLLMIKNISSRSTALMNFARLV